MGGSVVLVKSGKCWFHTKALNAEAAGAVAVVVYNDQRQMVDVMEGVDELASPHIPTVLIESDLGGKLQQAVGARVTMIKSNADGMDLGRPMTTLVTFRCTSDWHERTSVCQAGDQVDVKLVSSEPGDTESRWP